MKLIRLISTMFLLLWIGVVQVNAQFDVSIEVQAPSCNGYSDGIATAIVDDPSGTYTFLWSNGETSAAIYGMTVGDFSVTVTNTDDETVVASTTINEPEPISPEITLAATANICDGTNLGLVAEVSGGTAPYTYQWSNGSTEEELSSVEPGTYTLTITDANNCQMTDIFIINEPFELTLNTLDVICANFCDGSAEARVTGGIAPYTFEWSNGGTSEVIDLLEAGEYSVTVIDGNGCTLEAVGEITEPENMLLDVNVEGSCQEDENAIITAKANASGGTPPYVFTWSNGHVGEQTSDIDRGTTYFVTVTDANGCNMDEQVSVPLEPGLVIFPTVQNAACDSGDGGSASVTADGGTAPYLYAWSNGQTGSSISNLMAGTYMVTATDVDGCKGIDSVVVNDGTALLLFTNMVNASCSGMNDGMANVLAEGGQGPYTYVWDDSENQTSQLAINLPAGTYTVTVTDQQGCTGTESVTIGADVMVNVNVDPNNPDCVQAANGSATASATGGAAPYTYLWATGQMTQTIEGLIPGSYTVTATDANGCSGVQTVNLDAEISLVPDFTNEITACDNDNNVTVALTGTAITDISSWEWMVNGEPYMGQSINIPVANGETLDIQLTVSTAEGCTDQTTDNLSIDIFNTNISDITSCIGEEAQFNANPLLSYEWTPADIFISGQDTPNPIVNTNNPIDAMATVMITHPLGCTMTQMVAINIIEEIMPDPSAISTQQCDGTSVDFAHTIDGVEYMWDFGDGSATSTDQEVTHEYDVPGMYEVTLSPVEGQDCAGEVIIPVEVMEAPEAAFTTAFENCTDGTVIFNNMSSVPEDATYAWVFSNGETSDEENPTITVETSDMVMATLTISFGDDCELTTEQEVNVSVPPVVEIDSILMACSGEMTALNENGGDDTYIYTWDPVPNGDPNDPNPSVTLEETNTYNVTITDASGECEVTDQVTVEVPPAIIGSDLEDVDQCDNSLVSIMANSAQAESYQWYSDPALTMPVGGSGAALEHEPEGRDEVFYIVYTDIEGCTAIDSVSISNNMPQVSLMANPNLCAGEDMSIESTNLIEDDELTFVWTPADMLDDNTSANPTAMPEDTTTYIANISNEFGCMITDSVTINVIDLEAELEVSAEPTTILNGESTDLLATQNDKYTYTWTANNPDDLDASDIFNPEATPIINNMGTDPVEVTYNVMIMDENGCVADRDVTVRVLQSNCVEPFIFVPNAFTPNDDDINDVLYVRGYSITDVYFIIYNRWGEKVFETNDLNVGWDGRHKNELVCPDVYGYYLEVECFGGEEFVKKGNVTVLK